jgi:ribose transport system substrate-binding protein
LNDGIDQQVSAATSKQEAIVKRNLRTTILAVLSLALAVPLAVRAQDLDLSRKESYDQIQAWAKEPIDKAKVKKDPPYRVGLAAGYLSNSWILFAAQYVRYEASLHPEIKELLVTDAAFNPAKQAADIEDLLSKDIDLLLFWPVDEKAILPALQKAAEKGVVTVNIGYNFMHSPDVTGNAYVNQWEQSSEVARRLCETLGGKGRIFAMLPIAGSSAAVVQLAALKDVLKQYPGIELASVEYGDWNRAKAKQLTENLLQRFERIDGVFSPAGQMSMGVYEAFDEAGRLDELTMSPGDEYNGWARLVEQSGKWGGVTSGLEVAREAVKHGLAILKGEPANNAVIVETHYLTPEETAKLYQSGRPDDWWPADLPEAWLPK